MSFARKFKDGLDAYAKDKQQNIGVRPKASTVNKLECKEVTERICRKFKR